MLTKMRALRLAVLLAVIATVGLFVGLNGIGLPAVPAYAHPAVSAFRSAQAATQLDYEDVISASVDYLRTRQLPSGGIESDWAPGVADAFTTIKTVIALGAARYPVAALTSVSGTTPLDYLETQAYTYTHDLTGTLFPGRAGMLVVSVVAAQADPTRFGVYPTGHGSAGQPLDLVTALESTYHPDTGAYSSTAKGGYSSGTAGTINQLWSLLGLAAAQRTIPLTATEYLLSLQEPDGGWGWGAGYGDVDTTALALQALLATGHVAPTDAPIRNGLDFLRAAQAASGGWEAWGSLSADSTASVIQALLAAGYVPPTASWATPGGGTPYDDLLSLRAPNGSFSNNALSTAHAIPALAEVPLPVLGWGQRADRALTWVGTQQNANGSWNGWAGPDPGVTCDAVLAYAAAGYDPAEVHLPGGVSAMEYLSATTASFVTKTADSAGKLALAVEAAGNDAHHFGGVDIVDVLLTTWYSPTRGCFGDPNNSWHQAFAIMGLAAAGETVPVSVTDRLKAMQAPDGSWVDAWGFSKSDSTGLVLQALIAAGVPSSDTAVVSGTAFLRGAQNTEGSWDFFGQPNANTTAYVIQGLLAAGEDLTAPAWQKNGRTPFDALAALQKADGPFAMAGVDNVLATLQAVPALLRAYYPLPTTALTPFVPVEMGLDPDRLVAVSPRATWGHSINLVVPFGGDLDGDGSATLAWRAVGEADWITDTMLNRVVEEGYFTATLPVTRMVLYEFQVTFKDPDGVQYDETSMQSGTAELPPVTMEFQHVYLPLVVRNQP